MILRARYANESNTAVILATDDRGDVLISEADTPQAWAQWQAWAGETSAFDTTPLVPQAVSRRQGRLALLGVGRLDDAEAAIDAIPDPIQKRAAQIEYEAYTWERDNAFLQAMWTQLGGTESELNALFVTAFSL